MSAKRWTSQEELDLITGYAGGVSMDDISKKLERSANAVKLRLESIVYDNIAKGKTPDSLAKTLNTTADTIIQMYYSHKSFKEGKGEHVKEIDILKQMTNDKGDLIRADKPIDYSQNGGMKQITLQEMENENKLFEVMIKNYQMRKQLKKLYIEGKLDHKSSKLLRAFMLDK